VTPLQRRAIERAYDHGADRKVIAAALRLPKEQSITLVVLKSALRTTLKIGSGVKPA
jgi:hypothetical protein